MRCVQKALIHSERLTKMKADKKYIRSLAELAVQYDLSEISVKEDGLEIDIKRERNTVPVTSVAVPAVPTAAVEPAGELGTVLEDAADTRYDYIGCHEVKSPMVGVFYASPKPGDPPFVNPGDTVNEGDVLCIIEAMKIMNEIKAERSGRIVDVCCKDAELVEFGQTIFKIK